MNNVKINFFNDSTLPHQTDFFPSLSLGLSEIEGPQSLHVYPSQTAHFTCHATGKPPPKVTWFKDDQPIIPDPSRMVILPSGKFIHSFFNVKK